ncbi:MAG: molybdopterin-guanine dinucleotide biosynthesis protein B [Candidatus Bathyarchaeota archaeon]|nr:molybdopterin-guanine dinucleotide biosynthesis protein B [Candidatus Termiticorpusculum sp.]
MVLVVAAIGRSGSGKTVTIEYLIKQFSVENYRVGAVKHIHHMGFTIDTEGKNTWRYARAGARVIVAVSPDETVVIKKVRQDVDRFERVIEALRRDEELDIVFVEGYHELMAKRDDVVKIVVLRDEEFLQKVLDETVEPIVAISGLIAERLNADVIQGYPVIKIPDDGKKLVELIKHHLSIQKRN